MLKTCALVGVIMFASMVSIAVPTFAQNQLENPGFENGTFVGWTVGGSADRGVGTDGTPIAGTFWADNEINVRSGSSAAWAKLNGVSPSSTSLTLSQTVTLELDALYEVSFWVGLGTELNNAARSVTITVGGTTVFNGATSGPFGTSSSDFGQVRTLFHSAKLDGDQTLTFVLRGSETGLSGLSFDDFVFQPATFTPGANQLTNAGFESGDFTDWIVEGLAASGVAIDETPITGTIFPDNRVNVRSGSYAAWAKLANGANPSQDLILTQMVNVTAGTVYEASFMSALGTPFGDAGRSAWIRVDGVTIYGGFYTGGANGHHAGAHTQQRGFYPASSTGPVQLTFWLSGSGTGLAGFSFDEFLFAPEAEVLDVDDRVGGGPSLSLLGPSRPNPFRGAAMVHYRAPEGAGSVDLEVFDASGRRVRALVREQVPAGNHAVRWDGASDQGAQLASGVYFLRLRVGDAIEWRRIVKLD